MEAGLKAEDLKIVAHQSVVFVVRPKKGGVDEYRSYVFDPMTNQFRHVETKDLPVDDRRRTTSERIAMTARGIAKQEQLIEESRSA